MESTKHRLVKVLLVLCLIALAAVVWYLAFLPSGRKEEGTLVRASFGWERRVS